MENSEQITYYVEPTVRNFIDWTPDRIRTAELMCDAGVMRYAADLCDQLLGDDRISGTLFVRARGLLRLPLTFEKSASRQRTHDRSVRYLEAEEDFYSMYPVDQLTRVNMWGILLGVSAAQHRWSIDEQTGRHLGNLEHWHSQHLSYDDDKKQWFTNVKNGYKEELNPGDGQWVLYTPLGPQRPWMYGAWRAIARFQLLKWYAVSDWAVQSEKSRGFIAVETPEKKAPNNQPQTGGETPDSTQKQDNRARLVSDLKSMGRNGVAILPPGHKINIFQSAANTWETFKEQIDTANAGIAIAIAGQNLTSEIKGGSYAAADVHKYIANILISADADALSSCLRKQSLIWWAQFNLGNKNLAPWPCWDTTPPLDTKALVDTWNTAGDALGKLRKQYKKTGYRVNMIESARIINLPIERGEDEALALVEAEQQAIFERNNAVNQDKQKEEEVDGTKEKDKDN